LDTDGHSVLQEETSIISRNGQEIPIDISISGFEQNGKFIHMAVIRDITQRKHLEKAKYLAEKTSRLASIGVMAAGITHEINQPLNAIRVTSDSMVLWDKRNEGIIPLPLVDQLKLISSGARRIDEIIQHMRSFWVTPDREVRETFSLDSTVQEALSLIDRQLHTHMIESVVELNSRNFTMVGNRIHLEQIVINLVTNALQALDSQSTKGKQIWVTSHRDDGMAVLEVADNGPGLPDVATESLFDPFYSTKRHKAGTGLGLAIVQRYVEAQKGVISARNRDGGGAIFTITFPVEQKA